MRRLRVVVAVVLACAAAWGSPAASSAQESKHLRIVKQPGLGYLQLIVMREHKLIEKRAPGVELEWRQLTSGPVIRDAMVAGQIDIGAGGLGPFIQAIDRGLDWKTLGALNEMPLYLNCARPEIKSLKDLKPTDRIGMPAIGSVQHVILQMQADRELGDPMKLNQQIVALSHPDGTAAILSRREIACHLSAPPFQFEQLRDPGIKKVFDSFQVVGGSHTFNVVWASEKWVKANPRLVRAFVDAFKEATSYVNEKPGEAVALYATTERSRSTPEELLRDIKGDGIKYTMTPTGVMKFAGFMQKIGMIKTVPASWKDYAFAHLHGLPGN